MNLTKKRFILAAMTAILSSLSSAAAASAELELSHTPLFLTEGVDPNFFLTLDNSDSMHQRYLPDSIEVSQDVPWGDRYRSSAFNLIYYDPEVTYNPPLKADGTGFGQVPYDAAPVNPFDDNCIPDVPGEFLEGCPTVDLSTGYRAERDSTDSTYATTVFADEVPGTAYYYQLEADGDVDDDDDYMRVEPQTGSADMDNFANWYSYYRSRLLIAKTAVSRALVQADEHVRVGYQAIHEDFGVFLTPLPFAAESVQRAAFYRWLYDLDTDGGTPLIVSTDRVANLLSDTADNRPYLVDPTDTTSRFDGCRSNFHLLFTDGNWGDRGGTYAVSGQNVDGTGEAIGTPDSADPTALRPDPESYTAAIPFGDDTPGTLADAGFLYWISDLRTDDEGGDTRNNVSTYIRRPHVSAGALNESATFWDPANDPADWQHLVNYTVGMGVSGAVRDRLVELGYVFENNAERDAALLQALAEGRVDWDLSWIVAGDPDFDSKASLRKADDLWHMAINSRGEYFSAGDAGELERALDELIPPPPPTASGGGQTVALSSGTLTSNTALYRASFSAGTWTGRVTAVEICKPEYNADGELVDGCEPIGGLGDTLWDTIEHLNFGDDLVPADRKIFTLDPAAGAPVVFQTEGGISSAQLDLLRYDPGSFVLVDEAGEPVALSIATQISYLRGEWTRDTDPLSGEQEAFLEALVANGVNRLAYLRGENALETRNGGAFRDRLEIDENGSAETNLLGDILNSPPIYVGPPGRFYPDNLEDEPYSGFVAAHDERTPMLYFGANDGMLHGLDADTGAEVLAYIPSPVFVNLYKLSDPAYVHENYVDGAVTEGDVFDGSDWRTMIAGALGRGGQGIYLLDATDPAAVAVDNFLEWEFTDIDDADHDLGYTYGAPLIVKRPDDGVVDGGGPWAVAFGNGYNNTFADGNASASGDAAVYLVDVDDKSSATKISTETGMAEDPLADEDPDTDDERPNAIAYVTPVDLDGDFDTDFLYAGDLFGNLWRFDINRTDTGGAGTGATRIFSAVNGDGVPQPITTPVRAVRHPTGSGVLVLFGTGKYLEGGTVDTGNTDTQSFYGIWDDLTDRVVTRDELLQQEMLLADPEGVDFDVRVVSNRAINWGPAADADPDADPPPPPEHLGWYIDLTEDGERVHQPPLARGGRVIFVTVTPNTDPCLAGGSSWAMEVETKDGSALERISPFDYRNNGAFDILSIDSDDDDDPDYFGAGIRIPDSGVYSAPAALVIADDEERKYIHTSKGQVVELGESTGLNQVRPWREIR